MGADIRKPALRKGTPRRLMQQATPQKAAANDNALLYNPNTFA